MARFFNFVLFFGLIVSAIATWAAPKVIAWYASPPVAIGVTCDPAMRWAMGNMIIVQVVGLIVGAALGVMGYSFLRKDSPKVKAA